MSKSHVKSEVNNKVTMFTFNDPSQVLEDRNNALGLPEYINGNCLLDELGNFLNENGEYFIPPISKMGLAKLLKFNAYHGAIPGFKTNLIMRAFQASRGLSRLDANNAVMDYNVFGECYFYKVKNVFGQVLEKQHIMALNMRVKTNGDYRLLFPNGEHQDFNQEDIDHLKEYSVIQNIYGEPYYLGGIQSILLNQEATIFRRKFYINGAHAGYVFYTNDPDLTEADEDKLKQTLNETKGVGNFKAVFVHIPNGSEKAVQILPIGDFSSKDDLNAIKNISRDDIIAAWRVPPALANIIPSNNSGFGDIEKIDKVYLKNEILPIRLKLLGLNDDLSDDRQISFDESLDQLITEI